MNDARAHRLLLPTRPNVLSRGRFLPLAAEPRGGGVALAALWIAPRRRASLGCPCSGKRRARVPRAAVVENEEPHARNLGRCLGAAGIARRCGGGTGLLPCARGRGGSGAAPARRPHGAERYLPHRQLSPLHGPERRAGGCLSAAHGRAFPPQRRRRRRSGVRPLYHHARKPGGAPAWRGIAANALRRCRGISPPHRTTRPRRFPPVCRKARGGSAARLPSLRRMRASLPFKIVPLPHLL